MESSMWLWRINDFQEKMMAQIVPSGEHSNAYRRQPLSKLLLLFMLWLSCGPVRLALTKNSLLDSTDKIDDATSGNLSPAHSFPCPTRATLWFRWVLAPELLVVREYV